MQLKKWIVLLLVAILVVPCAEPSYAIFGRKKKKKKTEQSIVADPTKKKESAYDKLFKGKAHQKISGGFITLHKAGDKLYFEYPLKYMNRELLIASTASETTDADFASIGFKPNTPMHVKFTMLDSTIFLRGVNVGTIININESQMAQLKKSAFMDPIIKKFNLEAYNKDSSAVVFDVTKMFKEEDPDLSPTNKSSGVYTFDVKSKPDLSTLDQIKSFDDNVTIKTIFSYSFTRLLEGKFAEGGSKLATVKATRTLLLLPEKKMGPRISDSRVGVFSTNKEYLSNKEDQMQNYSFAHRWRIEPKDTIAYKRGELTEPTKPIVYYLDNAFPELWKAPIKEGILRWNKAFEKIGFKNVIQVRDFPLNDSTFDPDNLKYSCIRYVPTSTANAMGPSWVDPTTGEIINASVIVYNDVIKLNNEWRFVQTAQIDPSVRAKKMPDDILKESLAYVVSHEVGHTLGFMHNMAGSAAYPVDSLRSATFTQKYGTTASIMDYARYNYVAQPGDKGVKLTPPDLGPYDDFLIKWNYSFFPNNTSAEQDAITLEKWVDEKAGNPIYRYGKQQVLSRYDPSALEEDLGNDPIKAGEYGVKNLKYIAANLNKWIDNDATAEHRQDLYSVLVNQYYRYVRNVMYNIGGIYLNEVKDGTKVERFKSVSKEVQKASLAWVLQQYKSCDWLNNKELTDKFVLQVNPASLVRNMIAKSLFTVTPSLTLSSNISDKPYTVREYFEDIYNNIWGNTIKNRKLTEADKVAQKIFISASATPMMNMANGMRLTDEQNILKNATLPSIDDIIAYGLDETGTVARNIDKLRNIEEEKGLGYVSKQLENVGFGEGNIWQPIVKVDAIDESDSYFLSIAFRIRALLKTRMANADESDKVHYRAMYYALTKMLGKEIVD